MADEQKTENEIKEVEEKTFEEPEEVTKEPEAVTSETKEESVSDSTAVERTESTDEIAEEEKLSEAENAESEQVAEEATSEETVSEEVTAAETVSEENTSEAESPKKQKKSRKVLKVVGRVFAVLGVTIGMAVVCLYFVMLVLTHGPSKEMRDLFVLSVRESSAGGFLASMYLSKEEIAEIEAKNTVIETDDTTDTSIVTIAVKEEKPEQEEGSEPSFIVKTNFDVEVYEENGIEFHRIQGPTFTGIMMVVADPDRVFVGTPYEAYDGRPGLDVPTICERYGAIAAINGAFFVDTNGVGDGGTPLGFVFSEGNRLYGGLGETFNMMGFNEDGVLICGKMSGQEAVDKGIRDGVTCNPFLVINGEGMNVAGSGGGLNPRTALGQRADGAVLLLTIDGRQASSLGATMSDMVDVMLAFGAVNAGNLDGGGSTVCYYDKTVMNVVMSIYGTRGVPDAFCVRKEEK